MSFGVCFTWFHSSMCVPDGNSQQETKSVYLAQSGSHWQHSLHNVVSVYVCARAAFFAKGAVAVFVSLLLV